jgi:hypothetical protein
MLSPRPIFFPINHLPASEIGMNPWQVTRDSDLLFCGSWLWRINSLAREGHVTSAVIAPKDLLTFISPAR